MEYKTLGSLVDRKIGYGIVQPGQNILHGVPVIKVNNLIAGLHSKGELDVTTKENDEKYSRTRLEGGELIVSVVGTVGKTAIVPKSFRGCNLVRAVAMIDIKENWLSRWVKYYIDSPAGQAYIEQNLNTTVQATLNIKTLVDMPIPFLKEDEMRKIVTILEAIDKKIECNQQINDNLQRQAQVIYHERFETGSPNALPSDWHIVTLGEVATISNKSFNPLKEPEILLEHYSIPAFDEAKFPVFELSTSIKSNKFILDTSCFMISKLNPATKRVWKPYCLTGNAVCSTEFIVYKAKNKSFTNFLYSVIDSSSFSDFMCSHVTGSTGSRQRTTPLDTLSYELVLPSEDALAEFLSLVSPMYAQIRNNAIENDNLKRLRDSLLSKLMSGEIDVSAV